MDKTKLSKNISIIFTGRLVVVIKIKISVILVEKSLSYLDSYTCPTSIISFFSYNSFQYIISERGDR